MTKEKLKFDHFDGQQYVYFIRPKPHKNCDNMPVFLSVACDEEHAWSYVLKVIGDDYKRDYYVDDIFLSHTGQSLGLLWGDDPAH